MASVAASHPCEAKNSSLCSHLISLCHPSPVFKCGGGVENRNSISAKPNKRKNVEIRKEPRQCCNSWLRQCNEVYLKCMCGHVYLCVLAGCENVPVGA